MEYLRYCAAQALTLVPQRNYPKLRPCEQLIKIAINKIKLLCAALLDLINFP